MPAESAIIVTVPEAEAVVRELRNAYDPAARRGVPAHITLLYPFVPPAQLGAHIDDLAALCAGCEPFTFELRATGRFPQTAYLSPDPVARFHELNERIRRRWPQYKPYGGAPFDFVPHLTVADRVEDEVVVRVCELLSGVLPIRATAAAASLWCSDDQGEWSLLRVFPFGANFGV